jgi:hypothetical protein
MAGAVNATVFVVPHTPAWAYHQSELALTLFQLARISNQRYRRDEELRYYTRAKNILELLVHLEPYHLHFRSNLCAALNNLGVARAQMGWYEQGADLMRQAIAHQLETLRQAPREIYYQNSLITHYAALANILTVDRKLPEAVSEILKRQKLCTGRAADLYLVARDLAVVAKVMREDNPQLAPDEMAERQRYCDLAVEALRQAVAAGYRNRQQLEKDNSLIALRDHDGFKKLLAGLKG